MLMLRELSTCVLLSSSKDALLSEQPGRQCVAFGNEDRSGSEMVVAKKKVLVAKQMYSHDRTLGRVYVLWQSRLAYMLELVPECSQQCWKSTLLRERMRRMQFLDSAGAAKVDLTSEETDKILDRTGV